MEYKYLGDKLTAHEHKGKLCKAVRQHSGKCIRGKNGNMLIAWEDGTHCNVIGRLLRKIKN